MGAFASYAPLIAAAAIPVAVAVGWGAGWWSHHRTDLSTWSVISVASSVAACAFAVAAATNGVLAVAMLPVLAGAAMAAKTTWTLRRRALGAGGQLRQYELERRSLRRWLTAPTTQATAQIKTGGELVYRREITVPTIALDNKGTLKVASGPGRHIFACGRTGSGKTRTIERLLAHRLRAGAGIVVIDPKPDPGLHDFLRAAAAAVGRPFYLIDPSHPDAVPYNPLADKEPSTAADVAAAGYEFSEPHYLTAMQLHLDVCARVIDAHHGHVTLPLLAQVSGDTGEQRLRHWAHGTPLDEDVSSHFDELTASRARREAVAAAVIRMRGVANRRWAPSWHPDDQGRTLSLRDAVRERAVILLRPISALGHTEAQIVSAMILADLAACCTQLDQERDDWVCFVDELSAVLGTRGMEGLIALYQRARSAGGQMIVATQSTADLAAFTDNDRFTDSLAENWSTLIAHTQVTQTSREWISMLCGTREVWQSTDRTVGHGVSTEGSGSARRAAEFMVHPDELHQLTVGEVVVYTPPAAPTRGHVDLIAPAPARPAAPTGQALRTPPTPEPPVQARKPALVTEPTPISSRAGRPVALTTDLGQRA